ncbi:large conductance mechanosensitive channel protein MscL [Cellulophaga baltica 4]|nr:large conductance mechanosensitive channel protein MscL [Cellulophaga baltica 4]
MSKSNDDTDKEGDSNSQATLFLKPIILKKFFQEFKSFAIKGNLIDIAVGVIIGAAFNNVVNVLVKKILMPPLSLLTEGVNLHEKKYVLRQATEVSAEVAIGYGELVEVLIDFVIVAFTIFVVVKGFNRFKTKAQDPKNKNVETPREIELLSNLEKLMQEQNELLKKK